MSKKAGQHFQGLGRSERPDGTIETLSIEKGWIRTLEFPDEKPLTFDLTVLAKLGRLGQVIFHGASAYFEGKRRMTCISAVSATRCYLSAYLESMIKEGLLPRDPKPADLTGALIGGLPTWLMKENSTGAIFGHHTAYKCYNRLKVILDTTYDNFMSEFRSDFVVPHNPTGYSASQRILELAGGKRARHQQPLTLDELRKVQAAAAKEAIAAMNKAESSSFRIPPQGTEILLPFLILLVLRTCANTYAAANLRRDCCEPNPIEKGGWLIHFDKPRAGEGEASDYTWVGNEDSDRLSPLNIIRFLLRWTEALVSRAPQEDNNRLFLTQKLVLIPRAKGERHGRAEPTGEVSAYDPASDLWIREKFSNRHNLGKRIVPAVLRETGALMVWQRTKSVFQVQSVLNHKNSRVTVEYLMSKQALQTAAEDMAQANDDMTTAIINGKPTVEDRSLTKVTQELRLSVDLTEKIVGGEYFTGLGSCRDPYDSPHPHQSKGHLCSTFWACIDCGKAIFAREHLTMLIARQIAVKEQAGLMHEDIWQRKYGRINERLNQIIGCFSESSREEATSKVRAGYRQDEKSSIPAVAEHIRRIDDPTFAGYNHLPSLPKYGGPGEGVFLVETTPENVAERVLELQRTLGGQILCATHKGEAGGDKLNFRLHRKFVGTTEDTLHIRHAEGEPVIYSENDYNRTIIDKEGNSRNGILWNGSLGKIQNVRYEPEYSLTVEFDGELHTLEGEDLNHLKHAFAITVHRAQGSQFPVVIIPLVNARNVDRTWIYTAITRAQVSAILVGPVRSFEKAVAEKAHADRRRVSLSLYMHNSILL